MKRWLIGTVLIICSPAIVMALIVVYMPLAVYDEIFRN